MLETGATLVASRRRAERDFGTLDTIFYDILALLTSLLFASVQSGLHPLSIGKFENSLQIDASWKGIVRHAVPFLH